MLTSYEQFAVTAMMGAADTPPRSNGRLCFGAEWERKAFGVALALSKTGHFDWEDFRQNLIAVVAEWECAHALDDQSWSYYEMWQSALERVLLEGGLVKAEELEQHASSVDVAPISLA